MNIKKCRRILSLLLCVMLILSSMSIPVFAEEAGGAPCAHGNTVAREEAGEAASCTAEGSHTVITECADCGEELSRESVTDKALGHDYRETARTEASCSSAGSVTYTCSRCGDSFTDYPAHAAKRGRTG